ncbi:hypothetical protein [Microbacterium sp. gxy059]|uniref:hypothetical protein n=1 Tax=Microbacterium sp. gxy059 TaxID=2957199 RepID=UPI003D99E2C3
MAELTQILAALFALVGFILMSRGILLSKRQYKKKPRNLASGALCLVAAGVLLWIGSGAPFSS